MAGESASEYGVLARWPVSRASSSLGRTIPSTSRLLRGMRSLQARGRTASTASGNRNHHASMAWTGTTGWPPTDASWFFNFAAISPSGSALSASRCTRTAATCRPAASCATTACLMSSTQRATARVPACLVSEVGRGRGRTRPPSAGFTANTSSAMLCESLRHSAKIRISPPRCRCIVLTPARRRGHQRTTIPRDATRSPRRQPRSGLRKPPESEMRLSAGRGRTR